MDIPDICIYGYICLYRSPRRNMLVHIVYNHLARAAGNFFRYVCLSLMRFLNYLARAAATIFKYVCLFLIRFLYHLARAAGQCFYYY